MTMLRDLVDVDLSSTVFDPLVAAWNEYAKRAPCRYIKHESRLQTALRRMIADNLDCVVYEAELRKMDSGVAHELDTSNDVLVGFVMKSTKKLGLLYNSINALESIDKTIMQTVGFDKQIDELQAKLLAECAACEDLAVSLDIKIGTHTLSGDTILIKDVATPAFGGCFLPLRHLPGAVLSITADRDVNVAPVYAILDTALRNQFLEASIVYPEELTLTFTRANVYREEADVQIMEDLPRAVVQMPQMQVSWRAAGTHKQQWLSHIFQELMAKACHPTRAVNFM